MKNGENAPEGEPLDPKWEAAAFGREVQDFIDNDSIGRWLIEKAKNDLADASAKLIEVECTAFKDIAELQLQARVANRVRGWLAEAIEAGRAAEIQIQQERDEHGT